MLRLIPLEATILEQLAAAREAVTLLITEAFIMSFAAIRLAEVVDLAALHMHNHKLLDGVSFFAAVEFLVLGRICGALPPPLCAIDGTLQQLTLR